MPFLPILFRLLPYVLGLLVAVGLYWKANHWCNAECRSEKTRADSLQSEVDTAKKRATDLALLWAAQVDKTEAKNREADAERAAKFAALADRGRSLSDRPTVSLSVPLDRVWRDSTDQANAARPPGDSKASAPSVPSPTYSEQELAAFFIASAAAYADAYGQWLACVNHYESLRSNP